MVFIHPLTNLVDHLFTVDLLSQIQQSSRHTTWISFRPLSGWGHVIWVVSPCYVSTKEANCVKLPKTIYSFVGMGYPTYHPPDPLVTFFTFLFALQPPRLTYLTRFDDNRFTRYHFRMFSLSRDLLHPSAHFLRNIILVFHLVRPPFPPISLCTLLLFNLDRSSTLHPPNPHPLLLPYVLLSPFWPPTILPFRHRLSLVSIFLPLSLVLLPYLWNLDISSRLVLISDST